MLQKKPLLARSKSFRRKVRNFGSANPTVPSAKYTTPRARERGRFITSRQPSEQHPLLAGTITYFGFAAPWRCCFAMKTSSTLHTHTSNGPSPMQSITYFTWVARPFCRLSSTIDNASSRMQRPRLRVPLRSSGNSGLSGG